MRTCGQSQWRRKKQYPVNPNIEGTPKKAKENRVHSNIQGSVMEEKRRLSFIQTFMQSLKKKDNAVDPNIKATPKEK